MAKKITFEETLGKLEQIVSALETQEMDLGEAIKLYEEGVKLSRVCQTQLEEGKRRIVVLHEQDDKIQEEEMDENGEQL
ncbi:MAG: exodeoxyribonuclease VII small subunit [Eubacteriales bacterium]|nr:exodeoxyribonuclease VII small subunit [Eubacteriales bacterium]